MGQAYTQTVPKYMDEQEPIGCACNEADGMHRMVSLTTFLIFASPSSLAFL
jgi:hypothetical protein